MVRTKVFVGNLSFKTKEAQLAAEFSPAGKVISANIITRGPRSLGYGFVELDSEEDAQNAVTVMNKKEIDGRAINVEIAKPQDETKERQPRPVRPEGGENDRRKLRRPRRKIVSKKDEEEGVEVQGEGRQDNEGKKEEGDRKDRFQRKPRIRNRYRYRTGERRVSNEEKEESKTTLFVANLPFSLDDDGFGKIVSDHNLKLKSAHVVKKRNGRSKGYGFIEFDTQEEQQKALTALNKKIVDSRELSVKIALTEIHDKEEGEKKSVPEKKEKEKEKEEKKVTPEKKIPTPTPEKKVVTPEKKVVTPEKEEKKVTPEKKTVTPEKKTPTPEKKTATPEKKAATSEKEEKKVTPEKKTATPEKKAATSEKE